MARRPFIIPIFIPFSGCPHRCVFCDQHAITGHSAQSLTEDSFHQQVAKYLSYRSPARGKTEIAFYGGNFLGLPSVRVMQLLSWAEQMIQQGSVEAIRFSTRPDTIQESTLERLAPFTVRIIELGVQSMDNQVLALANRGHTAEETTRAVELLRDRNYRIGLQMMVGLPGDSGTASLATAERIVEMAPDFVRIYPTIVLSGSPLAAWYQDGRYHPLPLDDCVQLVKRIHRLFQTAGIPVVRMGLQPTDTLANEHILAGPFHPAFGELVRSSLFLDQAEALLDELAAMPAHVTLEVHPASVSCMRGMRNCNIEILRNRYKIGRLDVRPNRNMAEGRVNLVVESH